MRQLCRLFYLRNLLNGHPKETCCTFSLHQVNTSRLTSNISSYANVYTELKHLSEEFPQPKKILWKIINEAYAFHQNSAIKPLLTVQQTEQDGNTQMWKVTISMAWPEKFQVEGISNKKSEAEASAFLQACHQMKKYGILNNNNSIVLPERIVVFDDKIIKTSKGALCNIYQRIWTRSGKKEYIPKFDTFKVEGIFGKASYWKCALSILYPEAKIFEGTAERLREAESIASAKAIDWLKQKGIINQKKRLIQFSNEDEVKLMKAHLAPYAIYIPEVLQDKMTTVFKKLADEKDCLMEVIQAEEETSIQHDTEIYDVISDEVYREYSDEELMNRSRELFQRNASVFENSDPVMQEMTSARSLLPIADKREDILKLLEDNQVVVLSGETGCGKTTQVPQYLLDYYIGQLEGAKCNIVVTQPRRISAISIAERVASERGEKVGLTVGHQVRLNKNLPNQKGAILYCTTGMLLRKLCSNPKLVGVSHIIVDEVHERNIQIDFLLILLKRLLNNNKDIKLVMMSASFNTYIFSKYFNNCPVIHIPGKIYPVKEFFLEDLMREIPNIKTLSRNDPVLDADLMVEVINHIDVTQKPGAILCFLPGWHDILTVRNKLLETAKDASRFAICYAHSRLPYEEQKNIFQKVSNSVRKVILATNIAETSITIDDVVFVVNSGLHKGTSFDGERGVASLGTQWITKANVRQRRGRAGRVQSGVCYNLFTRKTLMGMDDYPIPELHRIPLERVILDCKLYCPDSKAEDFLSMALQPPSRTSLQTGVDELCNSGILDENENLTDLGKIIVNFATHPRLSIALVYSSFLGCLDPILTICAMLTLGKEPFVNTLEEKSIIKTIKQTHDNYLYSDHLAWTVIFKIWEKLNDESEAVKYIQENLLDEQTLLFIKELKSLFAEDLHEAGLIDSKDAFSDPQHQCNANSSHTPTIFAVLTAAFYPNVIKLLQGEIAHNRLNKDAVIYSLLKGQRGYIQKESVVSNEHELPSPWLVYFSALQSEARRLMMTSTTSSIPGICLLLFAGQTLTISKVNPIDKDMKNYVNLILDDHKKLTFSCTKKEAEFLMPLRNCLQDIFQSYIQTLKTQNTNCDNVISLFNADLLPVLKEILSTPQVPFTKGQQYKFVNGNLVSEDL